MWKGRHTSGRLVAVRCSPRRSAEAGGLERRNAEVSQCHHPPELRQREGDVLNTKIRRAGLCVDQVCRYFPVIVLHFL